MLRRRALTKDGACHTRADHTNYMLRKGLRKRKVQDEMTLKTLKTRKLRLASAAAVTAAATAVMFAAAALPSASARSAHAAAGAVLTMESSPETAVTQDFNPFDQASGAYAMGVDSLIYEPLMQFDLAQPTHAPYYMIATAYKWGSGGTSITFTIRSGVKFSNGSALTPTDVADTFTLLQNNADVNDAAIPITGATVSGQDVTITFSSSQYTNLENIANTYIVPNAIWSTVGDPGKYVDANPVGSGPYDFSSITAAGITLTANPDYWGTVNVPTVEFPIYASNTTVLSALTSNTLDWAGNFITGLKAAFITPSPSTHHDWFPGTQTNSIEPNLTKFPTDLLPVREAISLAISRAKIGAIGEAGLEPPATNASGLVLPGFAADLATPLKAKKYQLSPNANPKAADAVLNKAGYKLKGGYYYDGSKEIKLTIIDPAAYTDYAADDAIIADDLKAAHLDATFDGLAVTAWASDIADGDFSLTQHWSQNGIVPYQFYNGWLNSKLITKPNSSGNFEQLNNKTIDKELTKLSSQSSQAGEIKALTPLEEFVAKDLPIIPTVYGAAFDEYNSSDFSGWPTPSNPYESGQPGSPQNEIVVLHLTPTS
jgi:peptide/nickel transport system substrate-binding protein